MAASKKLLTFREFITRANPKFLRYVHLDKLIDVLQRVADGELRRLMIFMPPRHGKSELVSRLFSAYYLYRHPERWIGINSYAADLAFTLSRAARDNFQRMGGQVRDDAGAVNHWETGQGGGLWAAGVGGPITGKGFNLGIIDDPIKNAEEAASETIRAKHKDWYQSTFYTREEPEGAIVIIQTRWHQDDLSGWLLAREDEEPEGWHIVCFEAIKEPEPAVFPATCTVEPDFRAPGQALCPERYPLERLQKIARRIGNYFWNALFQQGPRPKEGGFFRRQWFGEFVDVVTAGARRVRYWDRAASAGADDYTAGVLMARSGDLYFVEDVVRGQWSSGDRDKIIRQTAELDRTRGAVQHWGEQEPGSSGKDVSGAFAILLAGFSVHSEPATGAKETRADPLASQAQVGNVKIVRGKWNVAFLDELCDFPYGAHDDQVDAASGAFNKLSHGAVPFGFVALVPQKAVA